MLLIGRSRQDILLVARVQQKHDPQPALEVLRVAQSTLKPDVSMNRMNAIGLPAAQVIEDGLTIVATGWTPLTRLAAFGRQMIQGRIGARAGDEVATLANKERKDFFFSVVAIGYPVQKSRKLGQAVGELF